MLVEWKGGEVPGSGIALPSHVASPPHTLPAMQLVLLGLSTLAAFGLGSMEATDQLCCPAL